MDLSKLIELYQKCTVMFIFFKYLLLICLFETNNVLYKLRVHDKSVVILKVDCTKEHFSFLSLTLSDMAPEGCAHATFSF